MRLLHVFSPPSESLTWEAVALRYSKSEVNLYTMLALCAFTLCPPTHRHRGKHQSPVQSWAHERMHLRKTRVHMSTICLSSPHLHEKHACMNLYD